MKELLDKLTKFQDEVVFVKATAQANYGKYAKLKTVVMDTREPLRKNGLYIIQSLTNINGVSAIKTVLTDGTDSMEEVTPLIHKPEDPQKWGAAITYARRYSYVTILGLLVDEDDDGQLASAKTENGKQYVENVEEKIESCKDLRELKALFDVMPQAQRLEVTKYFSKKKLELSHGTKN